MQLIKAGESHGRGMVGIITNVPAGINVQENSIKKLLKERRTALGRSSRQKQEQDEILLLTGIRGGVTLGDNVAIVIENSKSGQYSDIMGVFSADRESARITAIRPGHVDLAGLKRTGFEDARDVMEGASARNTCLDVASGAFALAMLGELGIRVTAFVRSLGPACDNGEYGFAEVSDCTAPAFSKNERFVSECVELIKEAEDRGDSLGGSVEIIISGVKPGFGNYVSEKRVNELIAARIMQIQAVKGLYFGVDPFQFTGMGSQYSATCECTDGGVKITGDRSGGINGGITNGCDIKVTVGVKPIPTVRCGVKSCDYITGEACLSASERADTTAVFAICPILKSVAALALCEAVTERLGCDNMNAIVQRYKRL